MQPDGGRSALLKIHDDAKTFEALHELIQREYAAGTGAVSGAAVRFLAESDPSALDAAVQERFAQSLSRMVESDEALRLAGVLET